MLVLFESPAGYSIFKIADNKKLQSAEDIKSIFESQESASKYIELEFFKNFKDTEHAVRSLTALQNGELPEDLRKFLKKNIVYKEIKEKLLCK